MSDSIVRRFVFLWHEVPSGDERPSHVGERPSHFDLMFEQPDGLRTWAVETLPREDGGGVPAHALPLHRVDYLEYEGEISRGRGKVTRVAAGVYQTFVDWPRRVVLDLQTPPYRGRLIFQSLIEPHLAVLLSRATRDDQESSAALCGRTLPPPIDAQLFADRVWEVCLESPDMGNSEAS